MSKTLENLKVKQKELFLDFHQNLYKTVLAKQYDKGSRFIPIVCTDNGERVNIKKGDIYIYVKVKTPDDRAILDDTVVINDDGTITLELTESMLYYPGKAEVELIFYDSDQSGKKETEPTTRLATMNFILIIEPSPYTEDRIIDSDEFDALTKLLEEAKRNYEYVIEEARKHAEAAKESEANAKDSENKAKQSELNAKTSETNAKNSADAASTSEKNAKTSETNTKKSEQNAKTSATNAQNSADASAQSASASADSAKAAKTSETNARTSEANTKSSETAAATSATSANTSASNAATSEKNAKASETAAKSSQAAAAASATNASKSETAAKTNETNSANYASESKSYAVGNTGTRVNENHDNSKYYYEQSKAISESLSGALRPMGTITFANLPTLTNASEGDMYNISNEFTTTSDFKEGTGYTQPAGTNVYKTADGKWDCLAGTPVTGVKGNAESTYRKGNINLTPENIGLGKALKFTGAVTDTYDGSEEKTINIPIISDGNVDTANRLSMERFIEGIGFDGTNTWNIHHQGDCITEASSAAKVVYLKYTDGTDESFVLATGSRVIVTFRNGNTATNPTLNVNNTGDAAMVYNYDGTSIGNIAAGETYEFVYVTSRWILIGDYNKQYLYNDQQLDGPFLNFEVSRNGYFTIAAHGHAFNKYGHLTAIEANTTQFIYSYAPQNLVLNGRALNSPNLINGSNKNFVAINMNTNSDTELPMIGESIWVGANLNVNSFNSALDIDNAGITSFNQGFMVVGKGLVCPITDGSTGKQMDYGIAILGKYNQSIGASVGGSSSATVSLIVGAGTSNTSRLNALVVTSTTTYGKTYSTSTADYAEYFEWLDQNPNNEDRVGYFVTLENDKIKIANMYDYILGIVSATPSIVGNNPDYWKDRFLKDDFGRILTDENGEYLLNPEYDEDLGYKYWMREGRPEWEAIGLVGILRVRDDGTCRPGKFCICGNNGIATDLELSGKDVNQSFPVMKRITDNVIEIFVR